MSIPLATTTITVQRAATTGDAFDRSEPATVRSGLRAVIGAQTGSEIVRDGSASEVTVRLVCDPFDLHHDDVVVDETTGDTWEVVWCARRDGLGVDHTAADLLKVTGRAAA